MVAGGGVPDGLWLQCPMRSPLRRDVLAETRVAGRTGGRESSGGDSKCQALGHKRLVLRVRKRTGVTVAE